MGGIVYDVGWLWVFDGVDFWAGLTGYFKGSCRFQVSGMVMKDGIKELFEQMEADFNFRVDFLHFLQLANNALSNIIQDYFSGRRSKLCRSIRSGKVRFRARLRKSRRLYQAICNCSAASNRDRSKLCAGIIYFDEDLFKKSNWQIFNYLGKQDKQNLLDSFNEKFFTDYERWEDFHEDWQCLWEKRDYLVHHRDRQSNGRYFEQGQPPHINDENVIVSLSRFLLNYLNEEFIQKIESHLNKQELSRDLIGPVKAIVRRVNTGKRKTKDECSRKKSRGDVLAAERRRRQREKEALIAKRDRYYNDNDSRHRLSKFRNLYYFVGKKNMRNMKLVFGNMDRLTFNDYKAIFDLYTRINMIAHRYLERLRGEFINRVNNQGDDFRELVEALPEYQEEDKKFLLDNLINIRNAVEHNVAIYCCSKSYGKNTAITAKTEKQYKEKFAEAIADGEFDFRVEKYCLFEVIACMMKAMQFYLNHNELNSFYTQLRGVLEAENYCKVKLGANQIAKVTNWSEETRQKYKGYEIDKRKKVKKVAGQWCKDVDKAKKGLKK